MGYFVTEIDCVPNVKGLRSLFLQKNHNSSYYIHLGSTKIYKDLRDVNWWNGIKKDIARFVTECPNCQQVKVEHRRLGGLTQDIMRSPLGSRNIPIWTL